MKSKFLTSLNNWFDSNSRYLWCIMKALVVIDMQDYFDACGKNFRNIKNNVRKLIGYFNRRKWPIVVIEFYNKGDTCPEIKNLIADFTKKVIVKRGANGAIELKKYVEDNNLNHIKDFVFCGINTCQCVLETANDFTQDKRCYVSFRACACICDMVFCDTNQRECRIAYDMVSHFRYKTGFGECLPNIKISKPKLTQTPV